MTDNQYIRVGIYKGEDVYYEPIKNKVYLEKDDDRLVEPNVVERKGLIDSGLITIINNMIVEVNLDAKQ
jgi:hypothetical protein